MSECGEDLEVVKVGLGKVGPCGRIVEGRTSVAGFGRGAVRVCAVATRVRVVATRVRVVATRVREVEAGEHAHDGELEDAVLRRHGGATLVGA